MPASNTERFVPGEFFDLTEDQQLTEPAFVTHASGIRIAVDDVVVGAGHRVDESYETEYEPPLEPERLHWPGMFMREGVFGLGAAERVERWRTPHVAVRMRAAPRSIATMAGLNPLLPDVELVSATTDAWHTVLDGMGMAPDAVQLVESWELPR